MTVRNISLHLNVVLDAIIYYTTLFTALSVVVIARGHWQCLITSTELFIVPRITRS